MINPNGYGHLYRAIDIIKYLKKKKTSIKIYCSNFHKKKIKEEFKFNLKIETFTLNINLKKNPFNYLTKLGKKNIISKSDLENFDYIISDNLINLKIPLSKLFFMANFLWSETNTKKILSEMNILKLKINF